VPSRATARPLRKAAAALVGRSITSLALFCIFSILVAACYGGVGSCQASPDRGGTASAPSGTDDSLPGDYQKEFAGQGESLGSTAGYMLRVILDLAVVCALVWLVVWLLRRFSHKSRILGFLSKWRLGSDSKSMRLLETMSLGPARSLHLVEVGDRILVVGSTSASISFIVEIQDPKAVEAILAKSGEASEFAEALRGDLSGYESKEPGDPAARLRQLARSVSAKAKGLRGRDAD
jgi:flagellar protein FliO/FliZ